MKATIKRFRWKPVEVEVPEKCPKCGAPFAFEGTAFESSDLGADTLESGARRAGLANGELLIGGSDLERSDPGPIEEVWALSCANCGKVIASEPPKVAPTTGATVPVQVLTREERDLVCGVIGEYGDASHPPAEETTLKDFAAEYAWTCVLAALKAGTLNRKGAELGRGIARILEATVHGEVSSW